MAAGWTPEDAPPPKRTFTTVDDMGRAHQVTGLGTDDETRCAHYDGGEDVVAFRVPCCGPTWPCRLCHDACSDHALVPWPADRASEPAVLCGACGHAMTIRSYAAAEDACPACGHGFNPGCRAHHAHYFDVS